MYSQSTASQNWASAKQRMPTWECRAGGAGFQGEEEAEMAWEMDGIKGSPDPILHVELKKLKTEVLRSLPAKYPVQL